MHDDPLGEASMDVCARSARQDKYPSKVAGACVRIHAPQRSPRLAEETTKDVDSHAESEGFDWNGWVERSAGWQSLNFRNRVPGKLIGKESTNPRVVIC